MSQGRATNQFDVQAFAAAESGNFFKTKRAIRRGFRLSTRRENGETILHAAARSGNLALVRRLVQLGADPRARSFDGGTVLRSAVESRNRKLVRWLVENWTLDVDAATQYGDSPLRVAVRNVDAVLVRYLLGHGANVDAKDANGVVVLYLTSDLETRFGKKIWPVVRLLIDAGLNLQARDSTGRTEFDFIAAFGSFELVQRLTEEGRVDYSSGNRDVLLAAIKSGDARRLRYFVEQGADVAALRRQIGLSRIDAKDNFDWLL